MVFENIIRNNLPVGMKQPRRGQIYVGFQCHQRCGFCYYKSRCSEKMFQFEEIRRQVDFEYEYGIRDFEITGGEPSEYKELRKICEYIKQKDGKSKIAVITNGGLYTKDVWDVIDEVLLGYHIERNPKTCDHGMFPLGSTYPKVSKCVDMANENNVFLRTNTVVGSFNLENLPHIVDDIVGFKPRIINFLPVNLFDEATRMGRYIDYAELRPILKSQIDKIRENLPDTLVFVRYMPFCDMEGYEKHIVGYVQHIYDWFDWNVELGGIELLDISKGNPREILGRYGRDSLKSALSNRETFYEKDRKCLTCRYNIICDGVEKFGGKLKDQIVPSVGKTVLNPMHFITSSTERLYDNTYGQD